MAFGVIFSMYLKKGSFACILIFKLLTILICDFYVDVLFAVNNNNNINDNDNSINLLALQPIESQGLPVNCWAHSTCLQTDLKNHPVFSK